MSIRVDSAIIRSRDNQTVKLARALQSKKARDEHGLVLLEGVRLIEDAVTKQVPINTILFSDAFRRRPAADKLWGHLATLPNTHIYEVVAQVFDTISDTENSQGIIATAPAKASTLDSVLDLASSTGGIVLALEGIQDPGNVGTIIRSAAAFGADGVIVGPKTADPYSPKCLRSSMGGLFSVKVALPDNWTECLASMRKCGRLLVADTLPSASEPWHHDLSGTTFVILANEGGGPSPEASEAAHAVIRIPMPGEAESLNVAVSASVLLYEAIRQRAAHLQST